MAPEYVIAVDLGQVNDPTAIAVLERREQLTGRQELVTNVRAFFDGFKHQPRYYTAPQIAGFYHIIHLERLPLGTAYTEIPGRLHPIERRLRQLWLDAVFEETGVGRARLDDAPIETVIDQTGVGSPIADLLREAGLDPVCITITSGDQVTRVAEREYRVPKRDLVGAVQSAMQARRLQAAASLPDWPVLEGRARATSRPGSASAAMTATARAMTGARATTTIWCWLWRWASGGARTARGRRRSIPRLWPRGRARDEPGAEETWRYHLWSGTRAAAFGTDPGALLGAVFALKPRR